MAAAAFLGGQSRLKAGCGQNCPPSNCKLTHYPDSARRSLAEAIYRTESSTSRSQSGRFNTSRGLLPSGGPIIPSRCIISKMRAARP